MPSPESLTGENFGRRLRRARVEAALTQEDLAHASGLGVRTIRNLEAGRVDSPRLSTIKLLAEVLKIDVAQLRDTPTTPTEFDTTGLPAQLPIRAQRLVGRTSELAKLDRWVSVDPAERAPVMTLTGTAGVGKTALAVTWAHRQKERFPDGQLYLNLRGYDPDDPWEPGEALTNMLLALGVSANRVPRELDARSALYRSILDRRRVLVLLDNASRAEQVRPLLPGTPEAAVVVTSRDALAGLAVREGAERIPVPLLSAQAADELLGGTGQETMDPESQARRVIASACARLPLALRIAATLVDDPAVNSTELANVLSSGQHAVDLLNEIGDSETGVAHVFSWSYRHLQPADALVFRLACVSLTPDVSPHEISAQTGVPVTAVQQSLNRLAASSLLEASRYAGCFTMHDLLRSYGRNLFMGLSEGDRQQYATNALEFFAYAAERATVVGVPGYVPMPEENVTTWSTPEFSTQNQAIEWLARHRASLLTSAQQAMAVGRYDLIRRLASAGDWYLERGGHLGDAEQLQLVAAEAARRRGEKIDLAQALYQLGGICVWQGDADQALLHFSEALEIYRGAGDLERMGRLLDSLGVACWSKGDYHRAIDFQTESVRVLAELNDRIMEGRARVNLASTQLRVGLLDEAAENCLVALEVFDQAGRDVERAAALENLAEVRARQSRTEEARDLFAQSVDLCRMAHHSYGATSALTFWGLMQVRLGAHRAGLSAVVQALRTFQEMGNLVGQGWSLTALGEVLSIVGHPGLAAVAYREALVITRGSGDQYEEAKAHRGLALASLAHSDRAEAERQWQQAQRLYEELKVPEAKEEFLEYAHASSASAAE